MALLSRYIYEDSSYLHSARIACDARISFAALACYNGAFVGTSEGFFGGNAPFCDNFSLDDVKQKCNQLGCDIGEVNFKGKYSDQSSEKLRKSIKFIRNFSET